jgi:hypothetical protein
MTTAATRRFRERAARMQFKQPDPIEAPAPPVPPDFRGWKGQVSFPDLSVDEIAVRYLNGGSKRPDEEERCTRRLVRAWVEARHPTPQATPAPAGKGETK